MIDALGRMAFAGWLGTFILLTGCRSAPPPTADPQSPSATRPVAAPADPLALLHEGPATSFKPLMDVITEPDAIECYRIDPAARTNDAGTLAGHRIVRRGPDLTPAQQRLFQSLVLDPRGYCGDLWCGIDPGVAFRFRKGQKIMTVLVCFTCSEWEFWSQDRLGKNWFIGLQPELLVLCRELFSEDADLKRIPVSDRFGRRYRIATMDNPSLAPAQAIRTESEWRERIETAVGDPAGWVDNGGNTHKLFRCRETADFVLISTAAGHAAIEKLDGIRRLPATGPH